VVWQLASPIMDLAYVVDTPSRPGLEVVPDGRCGVALVDGVPWWFGPQTRPWAPPRSGVHVVGVRLSLTSGRRAAGRPLQQWQDLRAPLCAAWGEGVAGRLADQAARATSDPERIDLLVAAASVRVQGEPESDLITETLATLVSTDVPVSQIARHVGLSPRQVLRRCLQEFGVSPSVLRRIARVHRAARESIIVQQPSLARLAADTGFADQAHFCREIRAMSGTTPGAVFG